MTSLWLHFESWGLLKPTGWSPGVVHLIKYTSQAFWSPIIAPTKCHLKLEDFQFYALQSSCEWKSEKVWVNFGNFREFPFQWTQNCLYLVQKMLRNLNSKIPTLSEKKKMIKFEQLHTNYSFAFRAAWILKSHLKTSQAYFIKWTTSGEPPVGLKSLQDSKWSHSEVILYIAHWLPPCRSISPLHSSNML